ncbi:hypothetical protein Spiaf_1167 [Spirochaeta africana DSM 8902]|uniref:Uncharacterized protein n=1 Tax=Spirochaeta africana (strain ATCC 700263 / DSM 8902 / Z-7692) TaxID=889378 RepID=H9UIA3_SPIAZ|nr:hypothetical protein Spiaf_1167 [Spirochaeta africana DSM 8902]
MFLHEILGQACMILLKLLHINEITSCNHRSVTGVHRNILLYAPKMLTLHSVFTIIMLILEKI